MVLEYISNSPGMFYVTFAFIMAAVCLLVIPRNLFKKYFLYGLVFGGIADSIIANIATLVGLHRYQGFEPFGLFGVYSIWTPITWTFAYMLFFYFLPKRNIFLVPYIIAWAALNYSTGLVMQNLGLFRYIGIDIFVAPLIFISWYYISALAFRKSEHRIRTD